MGVGPRPEKLLRLVIADTGPVLHLREADALWLLERLGTIVVPPAIEDELSRLITGWEAQRPAWLRVEALTDTMQDQVTVLMETTSLDLGEAEALVLAQEDRADWFVTDDDIARGQAIAWRITVHGSLGIVLDAAHAGALNRGGAEAMLDRLAATSLWVTPGYIAFAKRLLNQQGSG